MPKEPSPRRPAPQVNPVFIWPTPNKADLMFWVEQSGDLPKNKGWAYGDSYRDAVTYPNHKLVFVSPESPDTWSRWFYVSDRIEEDNYNFTYQQCDIGGRQFDVATRTYVSLRSAFDETAMQAGTAMPTGPTGKFTDAGYVLMTREVQRVGQPELDSLYVIENQVFIKKVTLTSLGFDELSGRNLSAASTWHYRGEIVSAGRSIQELVSDPTHPYWNIALEEEVGFGAGFTLATPDPDADGTYLKVADTLMDGKPLYTDDGNAIDGGTLRYILWSDTFNLWLLYVVISGFPGTYTPVFQSADDTAFPDEAAWELYGGGAATLTFSGGLGTGYTNGVLRECRQLSDDWWLVSSKAIISGVADGAGGITVRTYETTVNYSWPPVLSVLEFMDWDKNDGGIFIAPRVEMDPEGYSGPCSATVYVTWKPTPYTGLETEQMNPRGIYYASPFFRLNVPPCLHTEKDVVCDILSLLDPVWDQNTGSSRTYDATNYTVWPATIVAEDNQTPSRSGYLRTKVVVNQPDSAT